ncbi:hypothetical protein BJX64DRAFT_192365 [Aspergillus heterothallicus]
MRWSILFALAALTRPSFSRVSPYDPDDALRPDNVTGLVYEYYNEIGSYYNGTLTIRIHPVYNPPPSYEDAELPYLCDEYENRTFEVQMNAMAGFKKPPPASAPNDNPFFLDIEVWPIPYELRLPRTENYTSDQAFQIATEMSGDDGPRYKLNMSTATNTSATASDTATRNPMYRFNGEAPASFPLWNQQFVFNVSGICTTGTLDTVLYSAGLLRPIDIDSDLVYDWIDNSTMSGPSLTGSFGEETAQVQLSGAFSAIRRPGNAMVGHVELIFAGKIDSERSDQLLLGLETPDWNATLGFERASVAGVEDGAARGVVSLWILGLTGLMSLMLLM